MLNQVLFKTVRLGMSYVELDIPYHIKVRKYEVSI